MALGTRNYYFWGSLVLLCGFKNEEYYICSANRNRKTKETEIIVKTKQSCKNLNNRRVVKRNSRMEIIVESELNYGLRFLFYYSPI